MKQKNVVVFLGVIFTLGGCSLLFAAVPVPGYWNLYIDYENNGFYEFRDCFHVYSDGTWDSLTYSGVEGTWHQVDENKIIFKTIYTIPLYSGTKVGGVVAGMMWGWGVGHSYMFNFYAVKTNNPPIQEQEEESVTD